MNKTTIKQYIHYLLIAIIVGIATVMLRELISRFFPSDAAGYYVCSMAISYCFGIVLNFILHQLVTFRTATISLKWSLFKSFVGVSILGAILTIIFALFFRHLLNIYFIRSEFSSTLAFIIGAFTSSIVTYYINRKFIFLAPRELREEDY